MRATGNVKAELNGTRKRVSKLGTGLLGRRVNVHPKEAGRLV